MMYGISQDPDTKNYIIVLKDKYCKECGEKYTEYNWCKPCGVEYQQISNCTSENETIDGLIQEMRLKINNRDDILFEWIPYEQFKDIKEIGKDEISLATWKDGPLCYNRLKIKYERKPNQKVDLKYLQNTAKC